MRTVSGIWHGLPLGLLIGLSMAEGGARIRNGRAQGDATRMLGCVRDPRMHITKKGSQWGAIGRYLAVYMYDRMKWSLGPMPVPDRSTLLSRRTSLEFGLTPIGSGLGTVRNAGCGRWWRGTTNVRTRRHSGAEGRWQARSRREAGTGFVRRVTEGRAHAPAGSVHWGLEGIGRGWLLSSK
ncbi:hypothetical protein C8Q79DRAFT_323538 [Trametes meyenii]|nr:hypothetical protein C8Q79DRAFT_323538 [Trametes meyenii]